MSHICWRGEQDAIYKEVETFSYQTVLKPWEEARKGKPKNDNIC